jgi:hypothetical protein
VLIMDKAASGRNSGKICEDEIKELRYNYGV